MSVRQSEQGLGQQNMTMQQLMNIEWTYSKCVYIYHNESDIEELASCIATKHNYLPTKIVGYKQLVLLSMVCHHG